MLLSGFHPLTLLDFPGRTACIVFTPGCNFRCGFCHNPEFVLPEKLAKLKEFLVSEDLFFRFLERRRGLLDGVVICGGEPTIHADLESFIRRIKSLGYQVKLDSNGSNPEVLSHLLDAKLLDMVAMDIKDDESGYSKTNGTWDDELFEKVLKSIKLLDASGIELEFRTTVVKWTHTPEIIESIAKLVPKRANYALQNFRAGNTLDPEFVWTSLQESEMEALAREARKHLSNVELRY